MHLILFALIELVGAILILTTPQIPPLREFPGGFAYELSRPGSRPGEVEFLLRTVRFDQYEDALHCDKHSGDVLSRCNADIEAMEQIKRFAKPLREALRRPNLKAVSADIVVQGYASIERVDKTFSNLRLADDRAKNIANDLRTIETPPWTHNFDILDKDGLLSIHLQWQTLFREMVQRNGGLVKDGPFMVSADDIFRWEERCQAAVGSRLNNDQNELLNRLLQAQRPAFVHELEEGRIAEIWLVTTSEKIKRLINPDDQPPCTGPHNLKRNAKGQADTMVSIPA